jgi:cytochrome c553
MNLRKYKLVLFALLVACSPRGPHKGEGSGDLEGLSGRVSFDQVRSVFAKNCAACHPSRSGPDWLNYQEASTYAKNGLLLKRAVTERSMPPPGSSQAAAISDQDRALIGKWVREGAPEHGPESPRSPNTGKSEPPAVVQQCFQCHGPEGPGALAEPKIPRLAGQKGVYLLNQLKAFKWRERLDPSNTMNDVVSGMAENELKQMAWYYAARRGLVTDHPKLPPEQKEVYERGEKLARTSCDSCHRNVEREGDSSGPQVPLLMGQSEQYIINQLLYFRNRERKNPLMNEYAKSLSDDDIAALALFYSRCRL